MEKKAEHYYSETQTSELKPKKINASLRGLSIEFWTGSGVFSGKKVDRGSEILACNAIIKPGWRVLDLGCGYGAVGIAVAKAFPNSEVVMTDINSRAVSLARMNRKLNRISNASVVQGNMYSSVSGVFDAVLLNPPQTAGREVCFKMIVLSRDFLKKGGLLQVVARHNKGGKVLSEKMGLVFGNVGEIAKKSGYRVYVSKK